jgi:hypothetical protein
MKEKRQQQEDGKLKKSSSTYSKDTIKVSGKYRNKFSNMQESKYFKGGSKLK